LKFITYRRAERAAALGLLANGLVVDVQALGALAGTELPGSMQELIDESATVLPVLRGLLSEPKRTWPAYSAVPLENVTLLAPLPRPRKNIFGIGLNYRAHVAESARTLDTSADAPKQPVVFSKPPTAVIGPGQPIEHDRRLTQQLDWEVELAVIIGRNARRVAAADALDFVFGYSVLIDVSARDNRRGGQWIISKGMDTYAPFGPCIVTADEIPDPQNLRLWLTKNGEMKQDSNTRNMIFDVRALIQDLSAAMTLEPGDVIATGTPPGVGLGIKPEPKFLKAGDVVRVGIEGLGEQQQKIVKFKM
jgi:2-keto-4-pentenoate hydratase/2-oxohepta-3-ene-1,7-dioic acid hydratase in catechol pathway